MKFKEIKKRLAAALSLAVALSLGCSSVVQAATTYELFELVEGEASDTGYIPAYDPAEEIEDVPAGDESSITPGGDITDGEVQPRSLPENDTAIFDDGEPPSDTVDFGPGVSAFSLEPSQEPFSDSPDADSSMFSAEETLEPSFYTASNLPARYSLVESGLGTSVKDQGSLGICWAFSALESLETGMIRRGLADNSVSLSETHLAYTTFHGTNGLADDPTSTETFYTSDLWTKYGGNKYYSTATLARGYGPAYDSNYPLSWAFEANSADSAGSTTSILDSRFTDQDKKAGITRLKNSYWLREINPEDISLSPSQRAERVNAVKQFIWERGAVEMGIYSKVYDKDTNCYYTSTPFKPDHSITLVGWDDEKETPAGVPGAFLVQNSWGTSGGENGFYWLSYEDQSMKSPSFYEAESISPGEMQNLVISQYDGTGYGSVIKPADPRNDLRISGANVFVSKSAQYLKQVSFYAGASPLPYKVSVYRYVKSSPDTGTLVYTQSGNLTYAGYYTIDLNQSIPIAAGEKFAIQLEFDNKNGYVPHEKSNGNRIYTADYGESYLYDGNQWDDMMDVKDNQGQAYACNLCIKGIGEKTSDTITMAPSAPLLNTVVVSNGNVIKASVAETTENIDGYDFVLGDSPSFLKAKSYTSVNKNVTGTSTSFSYVPKGTYYVAVHAYRLNAEGTKVFSLWSDVYMVKIKGTTPGTPKLKTVNTGKGTLNASYTKASSAYRYEYVLAKKSFASTKLNPGSKYKTYTNRKYGAVKLTGLAKGTYYFGVRAYTLNGNTKVYGQWAVKKVTIK
ncbi:MAG: lectin like domain-containing protein [Eubacteriales bacterium]|nr:lectin like domain-containing protein [Eubacteriales bacterium]